MAAHLVPPRCLIDSDEGEPEVAAPAGPPRAQPGAAPPRERTPPPDGELDAITAERLHPFKWVFVVSPDGKNKTYYNTSTLVRIAQTKGRWMQPPHFRETMTEALMAEVLRMEGRDIVIDIPMFRIAQLEDMNNGFNDDEIEARGLDLEAHFVLDKRQMYVCPLCFAAVTRRMQSEADEALQRERDAAAAAVGTENEKDADIALKLTIRDHERLSWRRCPLEVLSSLDVQRELPYVVFANAVTFKAHFKNCHGEFDGDAGDYSLRAMLNAFLAQHNQTYFKERNFHRSHETTSRYWFADSRFNTMRYNRIRHQIDSEAPPDVRTHCAFDVEVAYEGEEVNFIVSDSSDDGSSVGMLPGRAPPSSSSDSSDLSDDDSNGKGGAELGAEASVLKRLEKMEKLRRYAKKHRADIDADRRRRGTATQETSTSTDTSDNDDDDQSSTDTEEEEDDDDSEDGGFAPTPAGVLDPRGGHEKSGAPSNKITSFEKWKLSRIEAFETADIMAERKEHCASHRQLTFADLQRLRDRREAEAAGVHEMDIIEDAAVESGGVDDDDDDDDLNGISLPQLKFRDEMLARVREREARNAAKFAAAAKAVAPPSPKRGQPRKQRSSTVAEAVAQPTAPPMEVRPPPPETVATVRAARRRLT